MARERGASSVLNKFFWSWPAELMRGRALQLWPSAGRFSGVCRYSLKAGRSVVEFQRENSTPGRISGGPSFRTALSCSAPASRSAPGVARVLTRGEGGLNEQGDGDLSQPA